LSFVYYIILFFKYFIVTITAWVLEYCYSGKIFFIKIPVQTNNGCSEMNSRFVIYNKKKVLLCFPKKIFIRLCVIGKIYVSLHIGIFKLTK